MTVQVTDAYGNLISTVNPKVTLTLSSGTFEGGSNTVTAQAISGVASFDSLKIDKLGSYTPAYGRVPIGTGPSFSFTIPGAPVSKLLSRSTAFRCRRDSGNESRRVRSRFPNTYGKSGQHG